MTKEHLRPEEGFWKTILMTQVSVGAYVRHYSVLADLRKLCWNQRRSFRFFRLMRAPGTFLSRLSREWGESGKQIVRGKKF